MPLSPHTKLTPTRKIVRDSHDNWRDELARRIRAENLAVCWSEKLSPKNDDWREKLLGYDNWREELPGAPDEEERSALEPSLSGFSNVDRHPLKSDPKSNCTCPDVHVSIDEICMYVYVYTYTCTWVYMQCQLPSTQGRS